MQAVKPRVKVLNPVDNWRKWWRWRSVQAGLLAAVLQALDTLSAMLPAAEQSPLLESIVAQPAYQWLKLLLVVAVPLLRLVKQGRPTEQLEGEPDGDARHEHQ